ncbi:12240_t:CDS:1, partial [Cetraspora pellucida]
ELSVNREIGMRESRRKDRSRGRGRRRGRGKSKGKSISNEQNLHLELSLLELPSFNPMQNRQPLHTGYATLPYEFQLGIVTPLALFQLFFTNEHLQKMVENTNKYEQIKGREGGRTWDPLTLSELKIWLGLIIYIGVHKINAVEELWNRDEKKATHEIKRFMSLFRFQQIKRFFHILAPGESHPHWFSK